MAIKSKEEILEAVKNYIGDDVSDEALGFIEDLADTLGQDPDPENWKQKYEDLDRDWRNRYKARFFDGVESGVDPEEKMVNPEKKDPSPEEKITYDDLFSENGGK